MKISFQAKFIQTDIFLKFNFDHAKDFTTIHYHLKNFKFA